MEINNVTNTVAWMRSMQYEMQQEEPDGEDTILQEVKQRKQRRTWIGLIFRKEIRRLHRSDKDTGRVSMRRWRTTRRWHGL